jgi:PAS domain S-box-containing protein
MQTSARRPRRRAEVRSGADFERLAQAIAALSAARDLEEIVEIVRRSARGLTGAEGIAVIFNDDGFCHYRVEDSESPLWTGSRFPADACISGWAMLHNQTVVISDIFEDPRIPHDAYRPTFVRSLIMAPVGEPPFAAIGAYWSRVRAPDPDEISVLEALARSAATAIKNVQLYESLKSEADRAERLYREAQQRLAEREHAVDQIRFQAGLLGAVEQAVIATDLEGRITYWSRFAERLYGWSAAEAQGQRLGPMITVAGGEAVATAIMRDYLQVGQSWSGELPLRRKDGVVFAAQITNSPIHDAQGRLIGIVGVSADISERKKSEQHLRLMVNELNHRVKNSLATVQSMASQTFRAAGSVEEAKDAFSMRLHALSLIHEMLTEVNWESADLREIALRTMSAHLGPQTDQVSVHGGPIRLSPKAASSLAIGLNELATNAVKYGALSTGAGRVDVDWRLGQGPRGVELRLSWRECGGPPVTAPTRRGFGERLLRRGLPAELDGAVDLDFAPSGVTCEIRAPLDALTPKPSDLAIAP